MPSLRMEVHRCLSEVLGWAELFFYQSKTIYNNR